MMNTTAIAKFREGLEELLFVDRNIGALARGMGVPQWDTTQETAYVTYDTNSHSIVFAFNPDFIETLSMEETAAVIAHETHHVALAHLEEMKSGRFPDQQALIKAQECIINDTVEGTFQLPLPTGVMRGMELAGQDCSQLSTQQAYDLFHQDAEEEKAEGEADGDGQPDSGDEGDSSSSASGGDAETTDGGTSPGGGATVPEGTHGCGGVVIPEGMEDAMTQAVGDLMGKAAQAEGMTKEEFQEAISNTDSSGFNPFGGAMGLSEATIGRERMNWRRLLARINPKALDAGKPKAKVRNNWVRHNRRLASVYPRVIMPVQESVKPTKDEKGDTLPVFVVALDLSGSIPRTLVKTLQGLLDEIPEDLIKAYPCTWSDRCVPFVDGRVCNSGGTSINSVVNYVTTVKQETGVDPYVLVITDGEYMKPRTLPGKEWFYMGVNRQSVNTIKRGSRWSGGALVGPDEEVYCVDDFKI